MRGLLLLICGAAALQITRTNTSRFVHNNSTLSPISFRQMQIPEPSGPNSARDGCCCPCNATTPPPYAPPPPEVRYRMVNVTTIVPKIVSNGTRMVARNVSKYLTTNLTIALATTIVPLTRLVHMGTTIAPEPVTMIVPESQVIATSAVPYIVGEEPGLPTTTPAPLAATPPPLPPPGVVQTFQSAAAPPNPVEPEWQPIPFEDRTTAR